MVEQRLEQAAEESTPAGGRPACSRQGLCGNILYQLLDSSFRWNDEGVSFRLYIIPACLPQTTVHDSFSSEVY